jgi:hypothetical protein
MAHGTGKSGSCLLRRHEGSGKDLECDWDKCTCNCHPHNAGQGEPVDLSDAPKETP